MVSKTNSSKKETKKNDVSELKKENRILKEKVDLLDKELSQKKKQERQKTNGFFKKLSIFLLATLSVISIFLFNISFWVKDTITDNKTFVSTLQPLISNEEVNKALSSNITNAIFQNVNIDQVLKENLPPNISFVAGPLSGQIKGFTESQISKILSSPQAYEIWTQILTQGQSSIINYLKDPENEGSISVNQIYQLASKELASTPLAAITNRNLPDKVGNIQIAEVQWLPQARQYLNIIERLPILFLAIFLVATITALALSRSKRALLIKILSFSIVMMILTLGAIYLGLFKIADFVKPENVAAAEAVYTQLISGLNAQTFGFIWLFFGLIVIAIFTAPYIWLKTTTSYLREKLDGLNMKIFPNFTSPNWLNKIGRSRFILESSISIVVFVIFALKMPPSSKGVSLGLIFAALVVITIEIMSSLSRVGQSEK